MTLTRNGTLPLLFMLTLLVAPDAMGQPVPVDLGTLGGTYPAARIRRVIGC